MFKKLLRLLFVYYLINLKQIIAKDMEDKPERLDSAILSIEWCGKLNKDFERDIDDSETPINRKLVVFIITYNGSIYTSDNHGQNLTNIYDKFKIASQNYPNSYFQKKPNLKFQVKK